MWHSEFAYDPAADGMDQFGPIVGLSLTVSLSAALVAAVLGLGLAALLALTRFPGRRVLVVAVNALLGLPPVVVGLLLYLLLSHGGPLGGLGLLFTPGAMVAAQAILATPIVAALAHRVLEADWVEYGRALQASGASRWQALWPLLGMGRRALATAVLAGFGRTVSEVGAVLVVGGNIAGHTRTMTTAIALETSKGNLALALALGMVLIGISVAVSATVLVLGGQPERKRI
ncbi:MAG: ABC transporter permease [Rhodospirillales bacterium 70-18]|nr:ABC transporter permease [Rhodospirillales bacterium]OJY73120.1 MAG: ABC transporter permease [Rhodospirillales bacterium 70-18]